jgi:sugar phosphate isomerase/epimerase
MNAENVRRCVEMLADRGYRGVLTIECEAEGGLIDASLDWMRQLVSDVSRRRRLDDGALESVSR